MTNLSAALLLDALHRKDVLSRGGYLHLDNRNSSAAVRFFPLPLLSVAPYPLCQAVFLLL